MSVDCAGHHQCEPDYYPTSLDDKWTCPDCGREHVPFRVGDNMRLPDLVRLRVQPDTLGWRSGPL